MSPELILQNHSMAWRIRARFAGKLPPHEYITPDIRRTNPGWGDEVFNRNIASLEFFLPTGHSILMQGFAGYNFFVEASEASKKAAQIEAFWICGKLLCSDLVEMWRIGNGKVVRSRVPFGHEWGGGPTQGWKPGALGSRMISEIRKG